MRIEQPVDEMKIAGSAAAGTNCELARKMGLTAGGESCGLFVPDMNPFELALAAQRVGQPIKAIADDAVNPFDPGRDKHVRKLVCYFLCHRAFSSAGSAASGRLERMLRCFAGAALRRCRRGCAAAARRRRSTTRRR